MSQFAAYFCKKKKRDGSERAARECVIASIPLNAEKTFSDPSWDLRCTSCNVSLMSRSNWFISRWHGLMSEQAMNISIRNGVFGSTVILSGKNIRWRLKFGNSKLDYFRRMSLEIHALENINTVLISLWEIRKEGRFTLACNFIPALFGILALTTYSA